MFTPCPSKENENHLWILTLKYPRVLMHYFQWNQRPFFLFNICFLHVQSIPVLRNLKLNVSSLKLSLLYVYLGVSWPQKVSGSQSHGVVVFREEKLSQWNRWLCNLLWVLVAKRLCHTGGFIPVSKYMNQIVFIASCQTCLPWQVKEKPFYDGIFSQTFCLSLNAFWLLPGVLVVSHYKGLVAPLVSRAQPLPLPCC